jgi:hypothetical protein
VDVGAAFVADAQTAVLVQPGDGALDDPALLTEPRPVLGIAAGDAGADSAGAELAAVVARVVGAVTENALGPSARSTALTTHGRDRIEQREKLGDVVPVAAAESEREWGAASAGQRMVL